MKRPPALTNVQRNRLSRLEPQLKVAARNGDVKTAKAIVIELQKLLRPTGHHMRLFQNKNTMFEAAMEAGELKFAVKGLEGIRQSTSKSTRTHLEATALLAICHLRLGEVQSAQPHISEVLTNQDVIHSDYQRRNFKKRTIERFDEEVVMAALRGLRAERIDPGEIESEAGRQIATLTEDEIYGCIGNATPQNVVELLLMIDQFAKKQLPYQERKCLPGPEVKREKRAVGRTVFGAIQRTLWRSLCDPESDVYKTWFKGGMGIVLNKGYIGTAIAASLSGHAIGIKALAVSVTALVIKMGIEVYCETFIPYGIMEARENRPSMRERAK